MIKRMLGIAALLALAGCTSFEVTRSQKFVDEAGQFVHVDYGSEKEPRSPTFS